MLPSIQMDATPKSPIEKKLSLSLEHRTELHWAVRGIHISLGPPIMKLANLQGDYSLHRLDCIVMSVSLPVSKGFFYCHQIPFP